MDLCKLDFPCEECVNSTACDFYYSKDPNGPTACVTGGMDPKNGSFDSYIQFAVDCPLKSPALSAWSPIGISLLFAALLALLVMAGLIYFNFDRYKRYRQMRRGGGGVADFVSLQTNS